MRSRQKIEVSKNEKLEPPLMDGDSRRPSHASASHSALAEPSVDSLECLAELKSA